jgi:ABC-type multidrug transport system fused ATPase/permease subunit
LFEGSIRSNLDPFNQVHIVENINTFHSRKYYQNSYIFNYLQETDETLWNALAKVNLTSFVISMPSMEKGTGNSISTSDVSDDLSRKHIAEKGSNLSVGQRQLLCLARAIVK